MLSHRKAQVVSRISAVGTCQPVVIVLHPHGWNGVGDARSRRQRPLPDRSGPCDTPPSECPEEKYGRGLDHSGNIEGNCICRVPGRPHSSRGSEVDESAPVNADEGWTERMRRGTTVAPPTCDALNAVRPYDGSTRAGLARLQADLWRALGGVATRPAALPDSLLEH